jgi:hypothetical protein
MLPGSADEILRTGKGRNIPIIAKAKKEGRGTIASLFTQDLPGESKPSVNE